MKMRKTFMLFLCCIYCFVACKNETPKEEAKLEQYYKATGKPTAPEWTKNATIYEVNVRQYSESGKFEAVTEDLGRLKEFGVDILWFMPIHEIGEKNRKGPLGSYYAVRDYRSVNPEFGTLKDFQALVDKAHEMGMYVLMDLVANHTAWDHPWVEAHPDWFTKDSLGNMIPPVPDWQDVVDLNYGNQEMRKAMIADMVYWVKEIGIDGYRCDVAGSVENDFWKAAIDELKKVNPEVFMLAEAEDPPLHDAGFHMTYAWHFHHLMNEVAAGKDSVSAFDTYYRESGDRFKPDAYRMFFTTNHDENSWNGTIEERLGKMGDGLFVLAATLPGMPLIYSGQEAGMNKRLEFFDRDPIDWSVNPSKAEFYKRLNQLVDQNQALWSGNYGGNMWRIPTPQAKDAFAFLREKNGNKVIVLANFSDKAAEITINANELLNGSYQSVFSGDGFSLLESNSTSIKLEPYGFRVFSNK